MFDVQLYTLYLWIQFTFWSGPLAMWLPFYEYTVYHAHASILVGEEESTYLHVPTYLPTYNSEEFHAYAVYVMIKRAKDKEKV